jgi:hypothetical protein
LNFKTPLSRYQLPAPPFQSILIRMESLILGEKKGFSGEGEQFRFTIRAAGIENLGNMPMVVWCGSDEVAVHCPMVVFAEGQAVGGVVVVAISEWDEVGGIDE